MPNPRLAKVYAKAILDIARESNIVDVVLSDMNYLSRLTSESREFDLLLQSPIVNAQKKQQVIENVTKSNVHNTTSQFLNLLVNKGREGSLSEIAASYQEQYNELNNLKTVTVTTASKMNDEMRASVSAKAQEFAVGKKVSINEVVNEEIIGGFILEVDDKRYDASVRNSLNKIKNQFSSK